MDIKKVIEDNKLISILDTYSEQENLVNKGVGQILRNMYENSCKAQMVVPVLGMQGMGKSTLINSVLGKNILPNDADETTCVPVEVRYGEDEYARVYFKDCDKEKIIYSKEELNTYVDNNENPANEKQVLKIVLYDSLELLKTGLIIVDLPGVGSMTMENAETTNEYIKNLCTAIFVIPTTPTIRKQEVVFIKAVWSQFPTAVFVQNHWDENERELEESVEYNTLVLKKIAKELHVEFDDSIIVVNAYNALVGRLNNDENMIKESNLYELIEVLSDFISEWNERLEKNLYNKLLGTIADIKLKIENKICEMELSHEELIKKRTQEVNAYSEQSRIIKKKIREVERYLDDKESEIRIKAKKVAQDCASNIRKDVFMLIDKGVTDGTQLSDAFYHYQEEYVPAAFDSVFTDFMNIKMDIEGMLEELAEMSLENNMMYQNESFDKKSRFKFEKSFTPAFGIAGGLGGLWAASSIAGPIGWVVAAGITVVGCIIGSVAKKLVKKGRGIHTKNEIEPSIVQIQDTVYKSLVDGFDNVHKDVSSVLEQIKKERKNEDQRIQEEIFKKYMNFDEKDKQKLQDDGLYLANVIKEMSYNERGHK